MISRNFTETFHISRNSSQACAPNQTTLPSNLLFRPTY